MNKGLQKVLVTNYQQTGVEDFNLKLQLATANMGMLVQE